MNYFDKTTLVETVRDLDKSKAELSNALSRLNKALKECDNVDDTQLLHDYKSELMSISITIMRIMDDMKSRYAENEE